MVSYDYDVAVVGAGPAGSVTAAYAANAGARVVMLERRAQVGEPVQCGELMPTNEELGRLCPGVPDIDELFETPREAISREFDTMRFIAPKGKAFPFDFDGYIMVRPLHDQALAKRAIKAGSELRTGTQVTGIEGHALNLAPAAGKGTSQGDSDSKNGNAIDSISAKVIVGADGPNSLVRRHLGLAGPQRVPVMLALMKGEYPPFVDLYFGQVAPGGYAWVFPKQGGANIGVGIQARYDKSQRNLRQIMAAFENLVGGEVEYRGGGVVPISGPLKQTVKDHFLLVGDSAGHVMPSNGGGICTAMMCGRVAGQVIGEHLSGKVPLSEDETHWRAQVGDTFKYSVRAKRLADVMFSSDWKLNFGMNRFSKGFMSRAISCKPMFWLF